MKKKFSSWGKACELREFKTLRSLPSHPNVISLLEAFLIPQPRELYFVFEYMEINLYQLIKDRNGKLLNENAVQSIVFQVLEGLYHIHSHGIFHRDMKPENILISTQKKDIRDHDCINQGTDLTCPSEQCQESDRIQTIQNVHLNNEEIEYIVKIGDFGLARDKKSKPPYTEYVSTRWYRAPEVLLHSNSYSSPIDLWAVGTIMVELYTLKPLFPGQSEIDQLFRISEVLGSPCAHPEFSIQVGEVGGGEWKEGIKLAKSLGFTFSQTLPQPLSKNFLSATPPYFLEFIASLLRYDPQQRLTALDALKHPYFVRNNLIFMLQCEPENIKYIDMEKKRKNDFLLFRKAVNLTFREKKNTNRFFWSKAKDSKTFEESCTNVIALPPLDIDAANNAKQDDFVLPFIKAISPLGIEKSMIE